MHNIPPSIEGVWVTEVAASSPLIEENVQPGDVIVEVNGEPTKSVSEFEEAIAAVKNRSKGELRLQQRREGAGATTADGTGGHDEGGKCNRRVLEPRLRVVQEAEGSAEAAVAAAKDRRRRKGRMDARRLPQPLAAGGRGRRRCYSDATVLPSIIATIPVTGFKCVYITVTHSRYQNGTSVTGIKVRYS